jgi:hypothetical protein
MFLVAEVFLPTYIHHSNSRATVNIYAIKNYISQIIYITPDIKI